MRSFAFPTSVSLFKVACVLACAFPGQFLLSSCSSEDDFLQPANDAHSVTISFDMLVNPGEDTRSGRSLWSRAPRQQVNDMKIYVFKGADLDATYVTTVSITEFRNLTPNFTQTESVTFSTELEEGTYSFLAVGYESDMKDGMILENDTYHVENTIEGAWTPQLTPGISTLETMNIVLNDDGKKADEVFAGLKQGIKVNVESKVVNGGNIVLNRIPAGLLGYFKNIPYEISNSSGETERVTRLAVVSSMKGYRARLLSPFAPLEMASGNYELLSFDLSSLSQDGDANRYAIPSGDWRAEGLAETPDGVKKMKNSVLGGCFMLPASAKKSERPTLQVVLYGGEDGTKVLKTYDVICSQHVKAEDSPNEPDHTDNRIFDIMANHYYSLGVKYTDSGDDPDDDPPGPYKPDDPIDLSKEQVIEITIDPRWDKRHDLTL